MGSQSLPEIDRSWSEYPRTTLRNSPATALSRRATCLKIAVFALLAVCYGNSLAGSIAFGAAPEGDTTGVAWRIIQANFDPKAAERIKISCPPIHRTGQFAPCVPTAKPFAFPQCSTASAAS